MIDPAYLVLALVDLIPSAAFLVGTVYLVRLLHKECGPLCSRLLIAGSCLVFLGGFLKASWKLLDAARIADLRLLSELQFVLLAPGFFLMLVSVIRFSSLAAARPACMLAIAPWKIPLLIVMVLCSLGMHGILALLSFRRGVRLAGFGFILAFFSVLGLGASAGGEQTFARQWFEEAINSFGQAGFAVGCYSLFRASKSKRHKTTGKSRRRARTG